jgi:hypothetical protein
LREKARKRKKGAAASVKGKKGVAPVVHKSPIPIQESSKKLLSKNPENTSLTIEN